MSRVLQRWNRSPIVEPGDFPLGGDSLLDLLCGYCLKEKMDERVEEKTFVLLFEQRRGSSGGQKNGD